MAKKGTLDHPKTLTLAAELRVEPWAALGLLEALWHFTAQYARRGDIGKHLDQLIADGCRWKGKPERMIAALVKTGWLDENEEHRLVVHDWAAHCEDLVRKNLAYNGECFVDGREPYGRKVTNQVQNASDFRENGMSTEGGVSRKEGATEGGVSRKPHDARDTGARSQSHPIQSNPIREITVEVPATKAPEVRKRKRGRFTGLSLDELRRMKSDPNTPHSDLRDIGDAIAAHAEGVSA